MHKLRMLVVLAATLLLATISSAFADHMTGRYVGTGDAQGIILQLNHRNLSLAGEITGADQGVLSGQSNGENNLQGYINTTSLGQVNFTGVWSPEALNLSLTTPGGTSAYVFVPEGSQTTTGGGSGGQGGGNGGQGGGQYYYSANGTQTGPIPFEQFQALITAGTVTRSTLVWTPGQPEWQRADSFEALAALFPPEPPAIDQYYTVANDERIGPLTLEELIARIAAGKTQAQDLVWKTGLEEWTPASTFEERKDALSGPPELPEAPPQLPEDQPQTEDGPPELPDADQPPAVPGNETSGEPTSAP